jgi:hypothetical protein
MEEITTANTEALAEWLEEVRVREREIEASDDRDVDFLTSSMRDFIGSDESRRKVEPLDLADACLNSEYWTELEKYWLITVVAYKIKNGQVDIKVGPYLWLHEDRDKAAEAVRTAAQTKYPGWSLYVNKSESLAELLRTVDTESDVPQYAEVLRLAAASIFLQNAT